MAKRHLSTSTQASQLDVAKELAKLEAMTVGELAERYAEVFGEKSRSRHKKYLIRRIIWRIQANIEGDLSERARLRAEELAIDAEVRTTPPKNFTPSPPANPHDPRVPAPGGALSREYKGRDVVVTVLPKGFEYDGERYKSLTAVAKAITGSHINGFRFFGLEGK